MGFIGVPFAGLIFISRGGDADTFGYSGAEFLRRCDLGKCSDERSQSQNKSRARERLLLKLQQINENAISESRSRQWNNHDSLERGNPVKKFSGPL